MKKAIETIETISTSELEAVTGGHCRRAYVGPRRVYVKQPRLQLASQAASTSGYYNEHE